MRDGKDPGKDGDAIDGFDPVSFNEYQRLAARTSQYELRGPDGAIAPMLALGGETGAILDAHKRYLRDRIDFKENQQLLKEELGDLLWYVAAIASAAELQLADVAVHNL